MSELNFNELMQYLRDVDDEDIINDQKAYLDLVSKFEKNVRSSAKDKDNIDWRDVLDVLPEILNDKDDDENFGNKNCNEHDEDNSLADTEINCHNCHCSSCSIRSKYVPDVTEIIKDAPNSHLTYYVNYTKGIVVCTVTGVQDELIDELSQRGYPLSCNRRFIDDNVSKMLELSKKYTGRAGCIEPDTFDLETGKCIARCKALLKLHNDRYDAIRKYRSWFNKNFSEPLFEKAHKTYKHIQKIESEKNSSN